MTLRISLLFTVLALMLMVPVALGEAEPLPAHKAELSFPLEKGQYFFIGTFTGDKDKHELERGVEPVIFSSISSESEKTGWQIRFKGVRKPDQVSWIFETDLAYQQNSLSVGAREFRWTDIVPAGAQGAKALPMEKREVGSEQKPTFHLYRIPYVTADGQDRYVLIAIGEADSSPVWRDRF